MYASANALGVDANSSCVKSEEKRMPFAITLENTPAGICVETAEKGSQKVKIRTIEFVSEEDGDILIDRLEGFASDILSKIPANPPIQPNQVQHLLAIFRRDR